MDIVDFKKLQQTQMEIMDEVHRVCEKNSIVYYIIGGTALGARRHGGFIPWDLDIDIAMPRKDYDHFMDIWKTEMASRFVVRDYNNTEHFTHPHALVCIKNTVLEYIYDKYNRNEENLGIYLDIFPLDKSPEDAWLQKRQAKKLHNISRIKDAKRGYCYRDEFLYRFIKKCISVLIFWTNLDRQNKRFDIESRKYNEQESTFLCSMSSHYVYSKQCMPASVYGKPSLIAYEGREYYAPEKLDEYLTRIYGDFMKLPPEEKRQFNYNVIEKVEYDH